MLAPATVTCKRPGCGQTFRPKRLAQRYCSTSCRKADFKRRGRAEKSVPHPPPAIVVAEKRPPALSALRRRLQCLPTDGASLGIRALQGDDYPLEYYEDGYPKLPACLGPKEPLTLAAMA